MCGIADWLYLPRSEPRDTILAAMSDSIRQRSGGDTVNFRNPVADVALARLRVSIIDLTDWDA